MKLEITALGIGHGDAILLRWQGQEDKSWNCLVDGGEHPNQLRKRLTECGVESLDLLIGTHPDSDHIGGLEGLSGHVKVMTYWAPPLPAFQRHLWLFGERGRQGIERCRAIEELLRREGTEILYPVEDYSSAPFGSSGPQIQILSPAARLVRHLLTRDDIAWLFASAVMPLGWLLDDTEEYVEQSDDEAAIDRALARGALRPDDISDRLRLERVARPEEKGLAEQFSAQTGTAPEFFGDSALNNTSIVCYIEAPIGDHVGTVLLAGDQENWTFLLGKHPRGLQADVLKAPHHGGDISVEEKHMHDDVIRCVRPAVVLVSANGKYGLPHSLVRDAAIRWGAAVVCTSERTQDVFIGPENKDECCHDALTCLRDTRNVTLTLDSLGIRSDRRACHPGLGSLTGPVIEVHQHIVKPSHILDRLAEQELDRHIRWVRSKLREIHNQRQRSATEWVAGSKPIDEGQIRALARAPYKQVLAAHLPTILAKGQERGEFWANRDRNYREAQWRAYTLPSEEEIQYYLALLEKRAMILFPDAADEVHRDPCSLVTRLETCGLAQFADAGLHFPQDTFVEAFWPVVVKAFMGDRWHCYILRKDVAFSTQPDERLLALELAKHFVVVEDRPWGTQRFNFTVHEKLFPLSAAVPIVVSGAQDSSYKKEALSEYDCARRLEVEWLPEKMKFHETHLGLFRRSAQQIDCDLECTINWQSNTYDCSFGPLVWDKPAVSDAPASLLSAIDRDMPLDFTIYGPLAAKLILSSRELIERTWLQERGIERLW